MSSKFGGHILAGTASAIALVAAAVGAALPVAWPQDEIDISVKITPGPDDLSGPPPSVTGGPTATDGGSRPTATDGGSLPTSSQTGHLPTSSQTGGQRAEPLPPSGGAAGIILAAAFGLTGLGAYLRWRRRQMIA
jgi:MYXO-CTERM domain-containing protein